MSQPVSSPGAWGPPPPPRPPAPGSVVAGRVVTALLLVLVACWAFGLLFATLASAMSAGGCGDGDACAVRGLVAVFMPWGVWLLSLVLGVVGLVVDWRRPRVWLWGLLAVALNALAILAVLVLLFGWTFWSS